MRFRGYITQEAAEEIQEMLENGQGETVVEMRFVSDSESFVIPVSFEGSHMSNINMTPQGMDFGFDAGMES